MSAESIVKEMYVLLDKTIRMTEIGYAESLIKENENKLKQLQTKLELEVDNNTISNLVIDIGQKLADNNNCKLNDYFLYKLLLELLGI